MVEYFSATRRGGAVDLSWYNGTDTEFTLTTPAQLAGVAALVNSNTADFAGKTIRLGADISLLWYEETGKPWWDGIMGMASTGSITDCYNVATVTGGHPRYGRSGVGGIAGLFNECTITNSYNYGTVSRNKDSVDCAMGGAIGFDRKSGTGTLENLYYLDTTNQYASNSGTDERITAITAADFATEDFLNRLNVDKCFVLQNGKYPELKMAAKAENSGSICFCYGISADRYGSAAGKRLVSGVTSVTLTACAHTGKTAQVPEVPATCTETGLTAGVRCTDCGKAISGCETIPATGHDYKDGKCSRCGAEEPTTPVEPGKPGEPSRPTQPEKPTTLDTPATGDSSNVTALWVVLAVAGVGIIVLVVLLVTKRKNKKD